MIPTRKRDNSLTLNAPEIKMCMSVCEYVKIQCKNIKETSASIQCHVRLK